MGPSNERSAVAAADSATRLFFSTLGHLGSESAELKAGEKLSIAAWSGTAETLSISSRELQGVVSSVLSGASPLPNLTRAELKDVLANGAIKYTEKPAELAAFGHVKTGFIQTKSGEAIPVIERTLTPVKAQTEMKVARISEMMPFNNYTPVTVMREPGTIVQQRMGLSLEDFATRADKRLLGAAREWDYSTVPTSFSSYLKQNLHFKRQVEQTQAQRSILGDFDSTPANFAVAMRNKQVSVGNIDMNQAFELVAKPAAPNMISLQGMIFSNRTFSGVERFAQFQKSALGKEALRLTGATTDELHYMSLRTDWFLKAQRFGPF